MTPKTDLDRAIEAVERCRAELFAVGEAASMFDRGLIGPVIFQMKESLQYLRALKEESKG